MATVESPIIIHVAQNYLPSSQMAGKKTSRYKITSRKIRIRKEGILQEKSIWEDNKGIHYIKCKNSKNKYVFKKVSNT